ncbi:MAG: hypothetical protein ACO3NK_13150, partial [Prochlorotrichaceae cyanobacterium]
MATLTISQISDYFVVTDPDEVFPTASPIDWSNPDYKTVKVNWREDLTELERRRLLTQLLPQAPYREWVDKFKRPEEVM